VRMISSRPLPKTKTPESCDSLCMASSFAFDRSVVMMVKKQAPCHSKFYPRRSFEGRKTNVGHGKIIPENALNFDLKAHFMIMRGELWLLFYRSIHSIQVHGSADNGDDCRVISALAVVLVEMDACVGIFSYFSPVLKVVLCLGLFVW